MLRWRIILGALLIAILAGLCWLDHVFIIRGAILLPLACLAGMLAVGELLAFYRLAGYQVLYWETYAAVLIVWIAAGIPIFMPAVQDRYDIGSGGFLVLGLVGGFLFLILRAMGCSGRTGLQNGNDNSKRSDPVMHAALSSRERVSRRPAGATTVALALSALTVLYIGGMLGFLILLRTLATESIQYDWGLLALVSLICVVKLGDTGAYAMGRLLGRHKMAPRLSPGKTWEGAAGGLAAACLGAWILLDRVPNWLDWIDGPGQLAWTAWLTYGLVVGVAGMLGDLAESLLKRDVGVKDSSPWMPGFGGVLDLLDSLLLAAPVAYLFWILGIVGPR